MDDLYVREQGNHQNISQPCKVCNCDTKNENHRHYEQIIKELKRIATFLLFYFVTM